MHDRYRISKHSFTRLMLGCFGVSAALLLGGACTGPLDDESFPSDEEQVVDTAEQADSCTGAALYTIANVNGDSYDDMIISNPSGSYLYLSNGNGTWQANAWVRTDLTSYNTLYTPGDFDGDGKTDLIITTTGGSYWKFGVDLTSTGGWITRYSDAALSLGNVMFTTGDFNGDGKTDVITTTASGSSWYISQYTNAVGSWNKSWYNRSDLVLGHVRYIPGQFDTPFNDYTDLVIQTDTGAYWYYSNGNGTWSTPKSNSSLKLNNAMFTPMEVGGGTDLLVTTATGTVYYSCNGDGTWTTSGTGTYPQWVYHGDGPPNLDPMDTPNTANSHLRASSTNLNPPWKPQQYKQWYDWAPQQFTPVNLTTDLTNDVIVSTPTGTTAYQNDGLGHFTQLWTSSKRAYVTPAHFAGAYYLSSLIYEDATGSKWYFPNPFPSVAADPNKTPNYSRTDLVAMNFYGVNLPDPVAGCPGNQGLACNTDGSCNTTNLACVYDPFYYTPEAKANGESPWCNPCGILAGQCCANNFCLNGYTCTGGYCSCGKNGEACCGTDCGSGLSCQGGVCKPCSGALGTPCCSGNSCASGLTCSAGTCQDCGAKNEACCNGNTCNSGLTCSGGTCQCGATNQACCNGNTCNSGLTCSSGTCQDCGAKDEACCSGTTCNSGLTCSGGTCKCGAANQACCNGTTCNSGLTCQSGTCNAPPSCSGALGTACCSGNTCAAGLSCFLTTCWHEACDTFTVKYYVDGFGQQGAPINQTFTACAGSVAGAQQGALAAAQAVYSPIHQVGIVNNSYYGTYGLVYYQ